MSQKSIRVEDANFLRELETVKSRSPAVFQKHLNSICSDFVGVYDEHEALKVLEGMIQSLTKSVAEMNFSAFDGEVLLRTSRAIGLSPMFDINENRVTCQLIKGYASNIIFKFATFKNGFFNSNVKDLVQFCWNIEIFAALFHQLGVARRTCAKGATLTISNGMFTTNKSNRLESLLNAFDEDNGHSILSALGYSSKSASMESTGAIICTYPSWGKSQWGQTEVIGCQYGVHFEGCDPIRSALDPIADQFKNFYGYHPLQWLEFLASTSRSPVLPSISGIPLDERIFPVKSNLFRRGYGLCPKEYIYEVNKSIESSDLDKMISNSMVNVSKIDHLYNPGFIVDFESYFLIDHFRLQYHIKTSLLRTWEYVNTHCSGNDFGRGAEFEMNSKSTLDKEFPGKIQKSRKLWIGGQLRLEIDLELREIPNLTIDLDCKSEMWSDSIDWGSLEATSRKSSKLSDAFSSRQSKIRKLVGEKDLWDFLGAEVELLASHFIVPTKIWIDPANSDLWWNASIPRVTTLDYFILKVLPFLKDKANHQKLLDEQKIFKRDW